MPIPAALPIVPPIPAAASEWPNVSVTGGDGVFWDLTNPDGTVLLQPGWTGFDLPPTATFIDATPGLPGASYQGSHDDVRPVFLPVYTEGSSRVDAVARRRALLASLHPSRGPAVICIAEPDGHRRFLRCVYTGGAEGSEGETDAGLRWSRFGLNFTAIDSPYWYGEEQTAGPWTVANPRTFFPLAPALFRLSGSQVLGGTLINNRGDVDAFPVWTLKGPASSLTLQSGDRVFTIDALLEPGESLTIDTDPAAQTIVDGTGANRWGDVSDAAFDLWSLPPGVSAVTVAVSSSDDATALSMSYVPLYLTK